MSTIKKQFTTIHTLLTEFKNKKLTNDRFEELESLMTSKVMSKTFELDGAGNVTRIFCYYHKVWEDVSEVPYGNKSSTSHGLNTMCKQGVSNWTKQQRIMKQQKAELLDQVANQEIDASELPTKLVEIEETAKIIKEYETAS